MILSLRACTPPTGCCCGCDMTATIVPSSPTLSARWVVEELFTRRGTGDWDLRLAGVAFGVMERVSVEGLEEGVGLVREEPWPQPLTKR